VHQADLTLEKIRQASQSEQVPAKTLSESSDLAAILNLVSASAMKL